MWTRRRTGSVLACALWGCTGASTPTFVPWPDEPIDLAFVLHVRDGILRGIDGPLSETEPHHMGVEGEDVHLVGLRVEEITSLNTKVAAEDAAGSRLVSSFDESCGEGEFLADGTLARFPLRALLFSFATLEDGSWVFGAAPAWTESLGLEIPFDDARPCASAPMSFAPFGRERVLFPDGTVIGGAPRSRSSESETWQFFTFSASTWIDDGGLLLSTPYHLVHLTRGGEYLDARDFIDAGFMQTDPPLDWNITELGVDPNTLGTASRQVWMSVAYGGPLEAEERGAVFELELSASGTLLSARTATRTKAQLLDLVVGADGTVVAVGEAGTVVTKRPGDPSFTVSQVEGVEILQEVTDAGWPERPFFAAGTGGVLLEIRPGSSRAAQRVELPTLMTVSGLAATGEGSVYDLWLAAFDGFLYRYKGDNEWARIELPLPAPASRCGGPTRCGRFYADRTVRRAHFSPDGRLLLALEHCSAVVMLDPADGCTEVVPIEGVDLATDTESYFDQAAVEGGRVAYVGSDASVIELSSQE